GARLVLLGGLFLVAGGTLACAWASSVWGFYVLAIWMGIGNGVIHPCDFAVLNANVEERRLGYAYAIHGVGGSIGWSLAPMTSYALSTHLGWRGALLWMGAGGLLLAGWMVSQRRFLNSETARQVASTGGQSQVAGHWLQWATLMCFVFLLLQAFASNSVAAFTPSLLQEGFAFSQALSTWVVTLFLWAAALGVLTGGVVAAHTKRHTQVAAGGLGVGALAAFSIYFIAAWPWLLLTCFALLGFATSIAGPSRDMVIRSIAPKGAAGRVYGFVYSGADIGVVLAPPIFGALIDNGIGRGAYLVVSVVLGLAILTVTSVGRRHRPSSVAA
ncbi:MAG: MFS transporter, partial [Cystobacterineae bacterium]|nr:MFS transporter [Cystobacterineae bacterium]